MYPGNAAMLSLCSWRRYELFSRSVCHRRGSTFEYINVNFVRSEPVGEAARNYLGLAGFFIKDTIEGEALRKSSEFYLRSTAFTAGGKHEDAAVGLSHQNVHVGSSLDVQLDLRIRCDERRVQRGPGFSSSRTCFRTLL